jgi:hypothetical protein
MAKKKFATVSWTAEDVKTLRPSWTTEQCEDWLEKNASHIVDELITKGWDILDILLPARPEDEGD